MSDTSRQMFPGALKADLNALMDGAPMPYVIMPVKMQIGEQKATNGQPVVMFTGIGVPECPADIAPPSGRRIATAGYMMFIPTAWGQHNECSPEDWLEDGMQTAFTDWETEKPWEPVKDEEVVET